jgi:PHO85 cyclin-5
VPLQKRDRIRDALAVEFPHVQDVRLHLFDKATARLTLLTTSLVRHKILAHAAAAAVLRQTTDSSTQIVETIWPTSSAVCRSESGSGVLPLRTFIQETLRRSRTSYSTLQVALYYLVLVRPHVPKHDFTMEQVDDCHASRALQCGRRMFLAALILASKYLQDRNYSARAWSKISGLNTQEINQNEMAFLLAVNWKLHISEEVYNRWTECVMKHKPSPPPSPGGAAQQYYERQCEDFKQVILKLNPELDNLDEISPWVPCRARGRVLGDVLSLSPRFFPTVTPDKTNFGCDGDSTPTARSFGTPAIMEPSFGMAATPGRFAPALGLLPTPRLTPQSSTINTPAASVASHFLGKACPAMGFAINHTSGAQCQERWPHSSTPPAQAYPTSRRSSLATSVSAASSPESMVSDNSRTSRSSSISSASSLTTAPFVKLDVQARCRSAKLCGERYGLKPSIAPVPEDFEGTCRVESPDSYTSPVGKDMCGLSLDSLTAPRANDVDELNESVNNAARALQELHRYAQGITSAAPVSRAGSKRRRQPSIDQHLHDDVRGMLSGTQSTGETQWPSSFVPSRIASADRGASAPVSRDMRKRLCCAAEAAETFPISSLHPVMGGPGGPGMWEGILN